MCKSLCVVTRLCGVGAQFDWRTCAVLSCPFVFDSLATVLSFSEQDVRLGARLLLDDTVLATQCKA